MPECTLDGSAKDKRCTTKVCTIMKSTLIGRALQVACNARYGTKLTVFSEQPQIHLRKKGISKLWTGVRCPTLKIKPNY